jgi:hypothetical protein
MTDLTMVYHDPPGCMAGQIARTLPVITAIFDRVIVQASASANADCLQFFRQAGAEVFQDRSNPATNGSKIGWLRRLSVERTVRSECAHLIYCDSDRVLHWAEFYADEFRLISEAVCQFDFTVLGRTTRAFDSHPCTQRDTEPIINRIFGQVSGHAWNDVTSGARGLSRAAAQAIVAHCDDDELSTDVSWPLYLQHNGPWSLGYIETDGLEFETADRFADEVAAAGGYAAWFDRLENDPQEWIARLHLARIDIEAMLPYLNPLRARPPTPPGQSTARSEPAPPRSIENESDRRS